MTTLAFTAALFFLSGCSALIYEVLWIREFGFLLGSATATLSAVLAAYMTGLAAGSWASARWTRRIARPLAVYGLAELLIGASASVVYAVLRGAANRIGPIGLTEGTAIPAALERFGVAAGILLVPTALMGATLPLLASHVSGGADTRSPGPATGPGVSVGLLYGMNTLGAAAGCFATGFFLIRLFGTAVTNRIAVGINIAIGLAAVVAGSYPSAARPGPAVALPTVAAGWYPDAGTATTAHNAPGSAPPPHSFAPGRATPARLPRFLAFACFACGALSLSNEVLYGRLLCWLLGNRVYASTTMLTAFLLGIALGSVLAGWLSDHLGRNSRKGREVLIFSFCQVLTGLTVLAGLVWFPDVLAYAHRAEAAVGNDRTWTIVRMRLAEALVVVAIPALASGASFPALIRALHRELGELGASAGGGYALNTLGCILGSLLTGFWLIPAFGAHRSAILIASGSILLGHRLLAYRWAEASGLRRAASVAVVAAVAMLAAGATLRHPSYPFPREGLSLVWSREEPAALIAVYRGRLGWNLYGDDTELSFPVGPETAAPRVQRLQAWLPLLLHKAPKRVLVIGLGFGVTTGAFASSGLVDSVETVELFRGVVDCAPLFKEYNLDPGSLPRSIILAGDGRYYLRHAGAGWDIITSNVTGPDLPGSSACYTREFFELAKSRLNPGGLFLVHAYGRDEAVILKTLAAVFPHVTAWRAYRNTLYLVAGLEPAPLDAAAVERKLSASPSMRSAMRRDGFRVPADLAAVRVLDEAAFRRRADRPDLPVNSDVFPVLEYRMTSDASDLFRAHF